MNEQETAWGPEMHAETHQPGRASPLLMLSLPGARVQGEQREPDGLSHVALSFQLPDRPALTTVSSWKEKSRPETSPRVCPLPFSMLSARSAVRFPVLCALGPPVSLGHSLPTTPTGTEAESWQRNSQGVNRLQGEGRLHPEEVPVGATRDLRCYRRGPSCPLS